MISKYIPKLNTIISVLMMVVMLSACKNKKSGQNATASVEHKITQSNADTSEIEDPCHLIQAKDIAQIIGWQDYVAGKPNAMNNDRLKSCAFETKLSGQITITFMKHKGNYLQSAFEKDISEVSGPLNYQNIAFDLGDQLIYGYGQDGPHYLYKLRWRYGNHTEKNVEYRALKKQSASKVLEQLKSIGNQL